MTESDQASYTPFFEARVFHKGPWYKIRFTPTLILWISMIILVLSNRIYNTEWVTSMGKTVIDYMTYFLPAVIVGACIWGYNAKQRLSGNFGGKLLINDTHLTIEEQTCSLSELKKLYFNIGHIDGEPLYEGSNYKSRFMGGPAYSAGLDSFISFQFEDRVVKHNFRLETPSQQAALRKCIRHLYFNDLMEPMKAFDSLRLEYSEIQTLKASKSNHKAQQPKTEL